MSGVTGAIVGGAVLTAGATAYAGSQAASATTDATNAAISQQQSALNQQAQLSAPYRGVGEAAIPQYEALLGITPPAPAQPTVSATPGYGTIGGLYGPGGILPGIGFSPGRMQPNAAGAPGTPAPATPDPLSTLRNMPGYQFAQQEGQKGIMNQASLGGGISGNTLADLTRFNQGLADTTYQSELDNLARAVGTGQAAAAGQAQNVGTAAGNIGSLMVNQGQTTAGIDANTIAGITKTIGGATDQYLTNQALQSLNNQVPAQTVGYG